MKLFEDEVKGKRILRAVIALNIICLLLLVFYVFNVISLELLHGDFQNSVYPWCSLVWLIMFVFIITLIAIQLSLDVDMMLFNDELDENRRIHGRVEVWIKVTSIFVGISTLGFSLSLFTPGRENSWLILIMGFGGLIFRFVLLSIGYQYLTYLRTSLLPRSINV